jgi:hypothetical protein
MLPELLLSFDYDRSTWSWGKQFSLDEFETSVIDNVAAVPVFVAKPMAKFLTVQKLEKQLSFMFVRAMEIISDAV